MEDSGRAFCLRSRRLRFEARQARPLLPPTPAEVKSACKEQITADARIKQIVMYNSIHQNKNYAKIKHAELCSLKKKARKGFKKSPKKG